MAASLTSTSGEHWAPTHLSKHQRKLLHNETGCDAEAYVVRALKGWFFSEVLNRNNPDWEDYFRLVSASIDILTSTAAATGFVTLRQLFECGQRIQLLDEQFANDRIGLPLDALHRCMGPDPNHPYAKITICRTTFPVEVNGQLIMFFFEKFLVCYAYLDDQGAWRSTVTPIHSHPLNFETVYFRSFGPASEVAEQEFELVNAGGTPLIADDGRLNEQFFDGRGVVDRSAIRVRAGHTTRIHPTHRAIRLDPFDMELAIRERGDLMVRADGLFRPHRVTVKDDPAVETRYFALDNYFGPVGRVLVYDQDGASLWSHEAWDSGTNGVT